ncbi:MAG: TRAP transporter substrate-binding protein DctP [Thermodesulfobacteriota bacterium]
MAKGKLLFVFLAFFLFAGPAFAEKPLFVWKTGTLAPKGIGYANLVRDILVPALSKATNGDVELKVYWGGVMGDDEQHLKKMLVGQLQAAGLSGQGTFMMANEIAVLGLPFLFRGYDEVDYIRHNMTNVFDQIVSQKGYRLLIWLDQDFDQIYSIKHPIVKVADFPKARFVTWFGPLEGAMLELLGASPTPMGVVEIPSSLRAGVVDSMIAPSIWVVGTQLYSTFHYVNPMKIRYVPAFCVCTNQAWNALSEKNQKALEAGRQSWADDFCRGSRVEAEKALAAMVKYGLNKVSSTPEQEDAIKEKTRPLWNQLAGNLYPKSLLDQITELLAKYRAENKGK